MFLFILPLGLQGRLFLLKPPGEIDKRTWWIEPGLPVSCCGHIVATKQLRPRARLFSMGILLPVLNGPLDLGDFSNLQAHDHSKPGWSVPNAPANADLILPTSARGICSINCTGWLYLMVHFIMEDFTQRLFLFSFSPHFGNIHCLIRLILILPMKFQSISSKETLLKNFLFFPLFLLTHYRIVVTAIWSVDKLIKFNCKLI